MWSSKGPAGRGHAHPARNQRGRHPGSPTPTVMWFWMKVTTNLVLVSAGIGTTPIVAFLDKLAKEQSQRKVTVLHADHSKDRWPGAR